MNSPELKLIRLDNIDVIATSGGPLADSISLSGAGIGDGALTLSGIWGGNEFKFVKGMDDNSILTGFNEIFSTAFEDLNDIMFCDTYNSSIGLSIFLDEDEETDRSWYNGNYVFDIGTEVFRQTN